MLYDISETNLLETHIPRMITNNTDSKAGHSWILDSEIDYAIKIDCFHLGGFFMPQNKFQEVIFTIIMVIAMVYAMIVYNIALSTGGLQNFAFLAAFRELLIMGPIAFILDTFIVGGFAQRKALQIIDPRKENPFFLVIAISVVSVIGMCPLMSLAATILFKDAGSQFVSVWLQTTAFNFPMALCWQLFFAGPAVRFVFNLIFNRKAAAQVNREAAQA